MGSVTYSPGFAAKVQETQNQRLWRLASSVVLGAGGGMAVQTLATGLLQAKIYPSLSLFHYLTLYKGMDATLATLITFGFDYILPVGTGFVLILAAFKLLKPVIRTLVP